MSDGDYGYLLDTQLFALLDRMLPAWATFSWAESADFFLDITPMDLGAFGGGVSLLSLLDEVGAIVTSDTGGIEVDLSTGVIEVGL
jgi:hypothetical protein